MLPEEEFKKRVMHKMSKRRKERHRATIDMPERFQDDEDADEDCTAPHGANAYMNQSVFGMIAAAGSQVDFNARFDAISSDDEDGPVRPASRTADSQTTKPSQAATTSTKGNRGQRLSEYAVMGRAAESSGSKPAEPSSPAEPVRALELAPESSSPETPAHKLLSSDTSVMRRMLEARAEVSTRPSFDMPRPSEEDIKDLGAGPSESLERRLMEIFGFDSPESVLSGICLVSLRYYNTDWSRRVPLLATTKRSGARLPVPHDQSCLLLCIPAKEIGESPCYQHLALSNSLRTRSSNLGACQNLVKGTLHITDTGSA
jgi:sterol 3beta-glucosyltransferase